MGRISSVRYFGAVVTKKCVFSSLQKLCISVSLLMFGGREFQILGPAEAKEEL